MFGLLFYINILSVNTTLFLVIVCKSLPLFAAASTVYGGYGGAFLNFCFYL
jgi:hypothetical protein